MHAVPLLVSSDTLPMRHGAPLCASHAAVLLRTLATNPAACEVLVQKTGAATCWKGLHACLSEGGAIGQNAASALLLLAANPMVGW